MDFGEALRRTMFEFRVSGSKLAGLTGVNASQISEFKNGNSSLSVPNLEKVIQALSPNERAYFLSLVGDVYCEPRVKDLYEAAEPHAPYKK